MITVENANAIVEYCTPDEITSCAFVNILRNTGINGIQITVKIIPWIILKSIPWVAAIFAFLIFLLPAEKKSVH